MQNKIYIPILLGVIFCALALYMMGGTPVYTLDDAYIVQHAINNLVNFQSETVFLDSPHNSGLTSIVHVGLITLIAFFIDINWSQFIVASLSYILFLVTVFTYSQRVVKATSTSLFVTILAAISGFVIEQFFNGLETGMLIFLISLTLMLFRDGIPSNKLAYALLPVLPFVRPELIILSGVICFRAAFLYLKHKQHKEFLSAFIVLGISSICVASYSIYFTGNVLPNTAGAKTYYFAESCKRINEKILYLLPGITNFAATLGGLSVGFVAILFTRLRSIFIPFALIFYLLYLIEFPGGVHHNNYRYQYVFYAFAVFGVVEFLALDWVAKYRKYISIILVIAGLISFPEKLETLNNAIQFTKNENFTVGEWVKDNISKDDVILIHDAGYISTVSNSKLVDLVGLKTSYATGVNKLTRWQSCGNDPRAIDAIATKFNAKYFVVLGVWDNIFQLTESLRVMGWKVEIADTSRDGAAYRVYKISK